MFDKWDKLLIIIAAAAVTVAIIVGSSRSKAEGLIVEPPHCQEMTGFRVLCDPNTRINYVMSCSKWLSAVGQAAKLGPEKYIEYMEESMTPQLRSNYPMVNVYRGFAKDAASFVASGGYKTEATAIAAALETCNWGKSS